MKVIKYRTGTRACANAQLTTQDGSVHALQTNNQTLPRVPATALIQDYGQQDAVKTKFPTEKTACVSATSQLVTTQTRSSTGLILLMELTTAAASAFLTLAQANKRETLYQDVTATAKTETK